MFERGSWLGLVLVVSSGSQGCLRSNDAVLQPDSDSAANSATVMSSVGGKAASAGMADPVGGGSDASSGSRAGTTGGNASGRSMAREPSGGAGGTTGSQMGSDAEGTGPAPSDGEGTGGTSSQTTSPEAGSAGEPSEPGGSVSAGTGEPATSAGAQDPDCDLTGIWIARQITVNEAIGVQAFSNNWYFLEYKQEGTTAEVVRHFDCGIKIVGLVTVVLPRPAVEAQLTRNLQSGRKLTMAKDGASCRLETKRFWSIRGAEEASYLPDGVRDSEASIADVAMALPLPTKDNPEGAIDPDGDGKLGLAFEASGALAGTRNSVQRDWTRWFTEAGYEFPASMGWTEDVVIRADFDNEESVLDPTSGLLTSGSTPSATAKHAVTLRFLGRDAQDPRVTALVKDNDLETCFAVQDALPAQEL